MTNSKDFLKETTLRLSVRGRGVLAIDESTNTIAKRFSTHEIVCTSETRRDYREMFFNTKEAMEHHVSGVILFDETIRQSARSGISMVQLIKNSGVAVGIKVDRGLINMPGLPSEKITEGLDGLDMRLKEYKTLGASFTKWRAVFSIDARQRKPSMTCIFANADVLARYAAIAQSNNMVPIVEPETLMIGGDHSIDECFQTTSCVLRVLFERLIAHNVTLENVILKCNMIVPGEKHPQASLVSTEEVKSKTLQCLKRHVPACVPSVLFLSGGQDSIDASERLNVINVEVPLPWNVSFSYGRALQEAAIRAWDGKDENIHDAQEVFLHRVRMNSLASIGKWNSELERIS